MFNPQSTKANRSDSDSLPQSSSAQTSFPNQLTDALMDNKLTEFQRLFEKNQSNVNSTISTESVASLTYLHLAAMSGSDLIVEYLINQGADVNIKRSDGDTALHIACRQPWKRMPNQTNIEEKYLKIAKLLIEAGADVNAKGEGGKTPLDCARGSEMKVLLSKAIEESQQVSSSMEVESDSGDRAKGGAPSQAPNLKRELVEKEGESAPKMSKVEVGAKKEGRE